MKYTKEALERTKIQALRDLYREEFGGTPGDLLKEPLIDRILDAQRGGVVPERSKRGRPSYAALNKNERNVTYVNDTFDVFEVRTSAPQGYEEVLPKNSTEFYGGGSNEKIIGETESVLGTLELSDGGYGFLRGKSLAVDPSSDVFVSKKSIQEFRLKNGDYICGVGTRNSDGILVLRLVKSINGILFENIETRVDFSELTPCYPNEKISYFKKGGDVALNVANAFFPIGKGQRCLISAEYSQGKTTLIKKMAKVLAAKNDIKVSVLLLSECPEEITDFKSQTNAEIFATSFDESAEKHVRLAKLVFEKAMRLTESGEDVVILFDGITKLTRSINGLAARNTTNDNCGISLDAIDSAKKFLAKARNIQGGGSLTVISTIDSGTTVADKFIYDELKTTANAEIVISGEDFKVFPLIDIKRSSMREITRIISEEEAQLVKKVKNIVINNPFEQKTVYSLAENSESEQDYVNKISQWAENFSN